MPKSMKREEFLIKLDAIGACLEARQFAARWKHAETAWEKCNNADWLVFLYGGASNLKESMDFMLELLRPLLKENFSKDDEIFACVKMIEKKAKKSELFASFSNDEDDAVGALRARANTTAARDPTVDQADQLLLAVADLPHILDPEDFVRAISCSDVMHDIEEHLCGGKTEKEQDKILKKLPNMVRNLVKWKTIEKRLRKLGTDHE